MRASHDWAQVVVFALGPGSTLQHAEGLVKAFEIICRTHHDQQHFDSKSALQDDNQVLQLGVRSMQKEPQMAVKPRKAAFSPTERYMASK